MAALLEAETTAYPELRRGEIIEGTVVGTDRDGVLIDIGAKSEGVVPPSEMHCLQPEGCIQAEKRRQGSRFRSAAGVAGGARSSSPWIGLAASAVGACCKITLTRTNRSTGTSPAATRADCSLTSKALTPSYLCRRSSPARPGAHQRTPSAPLPNGVGRRSL